MRRHIAATALAALVLATGAHAAQPKSTGDECERPDLAQVEMNACAAQAFDKADHELNTAYARLVKQEDAESVRQLQAAQRAWLQFRDLECVFETPDAEGSLGPFETASCKADLTKARTLGLKRLLRDQVH